MKKSFLHSFPYLLLFLFAGLLLLESAFLPELLGKIPERGSEAADYVPVTETLFLERGDGTYTLAEAVYPKGYQGSMPLVAIGHGFTGNRNSGGAAELAARLASRGIASVRMDFDPYTRPAKDSPQTHAYTLSSMQTDLLRGIGYSLLPTITSLSGICLLRIVWLYTAFAASPTLDTLYLSYPVSWALTFAVLVTIFTVLWKKVQKRYTPEELAAR